MTQISKRFLTEKAEDRILDLLWTSLANLSTKDKVTSFLNDLLTPTEKIMLGKRLAVAFMLIKGYDYSTINQRLKVSNPTIWNVKKTLSYRGEGYKLAVKQIMEKERWEKFWQEFDVFFEQIVPPRPGTNWTEVRRKQWEKRKKLQKPF